MVANVGLEVTEKKSKEHGKERRQNEERNKILALIKQAIDSVAADNDYDLVLDAPAVVYADESNDLSQKVLDQLSKLN